MKLFFILFYILPILLFGLYCLIFEKKLKRKLENKLKNEYDNKKKENEDELQQEKNKQLSIIRQEYTKKQKQLDIFVEQQEKIKNNLIKNQQEIIDEKISQYEKDELEKIQKYFIETKQNLNSELEKKEKEKQAKEREILEATAAIKELAEKQKIINEQILNNREKKDKEKFYQLQLSEWDLEDINLISQFFSYLHNTQFLGKAVYETYIKKPYNELVKRVIPDKNISGIYKITFIPTSEIYIGKSTNIAERWKQHLKTALGIGSLANSSLHTHMKNNGLENYSFEILEIVSKEKLSEREKFYINFFESNKYGFNMQVG